MKQVIDMADSAPAIQAAWRFHESQCQLVDQEIDQMLNLGIVFKSRSPYWANFALVKKKDGTWRPCVDFCDLN